MVGAKKRAIARARLFGEVGPDAGGQAGGGKRVSFAGARGVASDFPASRPIRAIQGFTLARVVLLIRPLDA
jgi:hypothetical protein